MYNFVDKSGYAVRLLTLFLNRLMHWKVTLRPEMTPTLARMILGDLTVLPHPLLSLDALTYTLRCLGRTTESGETKMILPVKWFRLVLARRGWRWLTYWLPPVFRNAGDLRQRREDVRGSTIRSFTKFSYPPSLPPEETFLSHT